MSENTESLREFKQSNIESSRLYELLPVQLVPTTENLRRLLDEYYQFLNQTDQPSYIIERIVDEHNIDEVVDPKFLQKLTYEVARGVPESPSVQKAFLLKRIIDYYNLRGNIESVKYFFKVFFGDDVTTYYPWNQVLIPSSGRWVSDTKLRIIPIQGTLEDLTGNVTLQQLNASGNIVSQGVIENSREEIINGRSVFEVTFIQGTLAGEFEENVVIETSNGNFRGYALRTFTGLEIISGGSGYDVNDRIYLDRLENVSFSAYVTKTGIQGEIQSVSINDYGQSSEVAYRSGISIQDFTANGSRVYFSGIVNDGKINNIELERDIFDFSDYEERLVDIKGIVNIDRSTVSVINLIISQDLSNFLQQFDSVLHDFEFYTFGSDFNNGNDLRILDNLTIDTANGTGAEIGLRFGTLYVTDGYYADQRGRTSNDTVIQDSFYYQTFSYLIKSTLSIVNWKADFENLVHPSGFEVFNQIDTTGEFNVGVDFQENINIDDDFQSPSLSALENMAINTHATLNTQPYVKGVYFLGDYVSTYFEEIDSDQQGNTSSFASLEFPS